MEYIKLETKLGVVFIKPNSMYNIYVGSDTGHRSPTEVLTVNGIGYTVSIHMYMYVVDGKFHIGEDGKYNGFYATRVGSLGDCYTPAARKKITEVLEEAVNTFVESHPEIMKEAEMETKREAIDKKFEELRTKQKEMLKLQEEIDSLQNQLDQLTSVKYETV